MQSLSVLTKIAGRFCRIAILSLALTASAFSAELELNKLQTLANDIEKTVIVEQPEPKKQESHPVVQNERFLLSNFRGAISRGDLNQLQSTLEQLAAVLGSAPLRERCVRAAADIRALREAKDKEARAEFERLVQRATEAVRNATKTPDLDEILIELNKFRRARQDQAYSQPNSVATELDQVIRFVTFWQDYIAQSEGHNTKAAEDTLRNMAGEPANALIPRSEILARRYGTLAPVETPASASPTPSPKQDPMAQLVLKTPDDLLPAIEKMTALYKTPNQVTGEERIALSNFIAAMSSLANSYAEFKAGLTTKIEIVATDHVRDQFGPVLVPIRAQILKLVLPRYLGLPPDFKPKPDEAVQEFLDRVIDDAVKKGDFLLAAQGRETQTVLRQGKVPDTKESSQAALFIAAHNQEVASQYALAVTSYQRALATGTDVIPPKIIGDRLAKIKAEHPQEFASGLDTFLTPRMPELPPGFSEMYLPPNAQRSPHRPGPPQSTILQVPAPPAASETPSPAPSSAKK
jgi:hypothetical protein